MEWKVDDRDSMSLIICKGHIRAYKGAFQIFCSWWFHGKIDIKVKYLTSLSAFYSPIWKAQKWYQSSKVMSELHLNMVCRDPVWKQENFYMGPYRSNLCEHPSCIPTLVYLSAGMSRDHKFLNRIELSQLVQLVIALLVIWHLLGLGVGGWFVVVWRTPMHAYTHIHMHAC